MSLQNIVWRPLKVDAKKLELLAYMKAQFVISQSFVLLSRKSESINMSTTMNEGSIKSRNNLKNFSNTPSKKKGGSAFGNKMRVNKPETNLKKMGIQTATYILFSGKRPNSQITSNHFFRIKKFSPTFFNICYES